MRVVYDDAKQSLMVNTIDTALSALKVESVADPRRDGRLSDAKLKEYLNQYLAHQGMRIGKRASHLRGIGNNCQYAVFYKPRGVAPVHPMYEETHICGYLNVNLGMNGELYVSTEDYDANFVGPMYRIGKDGMSVSRKLKNNEEE